MIHDEDLDRYVETDEFKRRCAEVVARQKAGEELSVGDIASALGVPLWFSEMAMAETVRRRAAQVFPPETNKVQ